jgi:hypothetical protein
MVLPVVAGLIMVLGGVIVLVARPQAADPIRLRVRPSRRR